MKSQQTSSKISISDIKPSAGSRGSSLSHHTESLEDACKCEVMQPGLYDIETEMCTPELDDAKQFIPPEIQSNILEKTPVKFSSFILIFIY